MFWIGTSWKMNKDNAQAREAARVLSKATFTPTTQPFIIPPFTAIEPVATALRDTPILVGAQNMHWDDTGAWTGEVSAPMLVSCGARLVELGHSERRTHFAETDDTVNRKVHAALRHGLTPLICIGETADERNWGVAHEVLARQTRIALHGLSPEQACRALIAYEPVWAIGASGRAAEPPVVAQAMRGIHATLVAISPSLAAVPVLYGGSVTETNAPDYAALPEVGGLFVGRAAWDPDAFIRLATSIRA